MAKRKMASEVVDTDTGEVSSGPVINVDGSPEGIKKFSDMVGKVAQRAATRDLIVDDGRPPWETPQEALRAIRDQRIKCDRLQHDHESTKLQAKELAAKLEDEESSLRLMLRSLGQLKLFRLLLVLGLGLVAWSCAPVAAQAPIGPGAPGGWEDLPRRVDDFHVLTIEPGVGLLIDNKTGRGWILAGSPQSWQAIEPVGSL
jgi:hypothetical protein